MNNRFQAHTFHIPVMGLGYTIDSPVKVAQYGIPSVISLADDILMEKMREFYSLKLDLPFQAISEKIDDFRAKRITAYLNLIDKIVKEKFEELKNSIHKKGSEFEKYMEMLPDASSIKLKFNQLKEQTNVKDLIAWIQQNLHVGSIDVNIMTKLDRENYKDGEKLPPEYNDAHAALRGFAESKLSSSIVFSAGMSPRLYSYVEKFKDFYPDETGVIKKKIILKVSDYRSALVQGKMFAKKGLWVSEYRVESGLNCGGHAFATQGYLLGPILEEFKNSRETMIQSLFEIYSHALKEQNRACPENAPGFRITAQGGVGTADEHSFLLDYYGLDSIGWGSPFLLVPEASNVDKETIKLLCEGTEDDYYLSGISPLGVPFNSIRGNSKDIEKMENVRIGSPGFVCTKRKLVYNTEFTERPICTASKPYQKLKIKQLQDKQLPEAEYQKEFDKIVEKACLCVGLATTALMVNNIDLKNHGGGVTICPGPNLAYFDQTYSLKQMVDHIYGRTNLINHKNRPHMFVKELQMYVEYLKNKLDETIKPIADKQMEYFRLFHKNLNEGIIYYRSLFSNFKPESKVFIDLERLEKQLNDIELTQA